MSNKIVKNLGNICHILLCSFCLLLCDGAKFVNIGVSSCGSGSFAALPYDFGPMHYGTSCSFLGVLC